jgi:hypothetical protein
MLNQYFCIFSIGLLLGSSSMCCDDDEDGLSPGEKNLLVCFRTLPADQLFDAIMQRDFGIAADKAKWDKNKEPLISHLMSEHPQAKAYIDFGLKNKKFDITDVLWAIKKYSEETKKAIFDLMLQNDNFKDLLLEKHKDMTLLSYCREHHKKAYEAAIARFPGLVQI